MKRRTKIVATLGPAVDSPERIRELIDAGMNVARINCSHGDWESRARWVEWIREASPKLGPVGILADLQGPKFRIGAFPEGFIMVTPGQSLMVGQREGDIVIPGDAMFEAMKPHDRVLLGDGDVELRLVNRQGEFFEAKAVFGGKVKSRQGVTLIGRSFNVPAITDKDREDVYEALKCGVDFIALSYVRQAADLRELRRLVDKYDSTIRLCAKIETREAVKELDEILKVSDVVMVARGDLGLQLPLEEVPYLQKLIAKKCAQYGKPVIIATQMLESMISLPRPTRAEVADVANAIYDGADAVMLSGETATGMYPIDTVKTMSRIATETEGDVDYNARLQDEFRAPGAVASTEAVAGAAVVLARALKVKAIVCTTTSGTTPRWVAKFRPKAPIYCASWNERTQRQMAVIWGVEALNIPLPSNTDEIVQNSCDAFLKAKRLKVNDTVVVTAGTLSGSAGNTNLIMVETIR